jgi:hypothetical protein
MYHTEVRRFNPENYKIAADRIGGDNVMTKVWWECALPKIQTI